MLGRERYFGRAGLNGYSFSPEEIAHLYCTNKGFKSAIDSDKYIFLDNKIVLKSTECIEVGATGKLDTCNISEDNISEYCLRFFYYRAAVCHRLRPRQSRGFRPRTSGFRSIRPVLQEAAKASSVENVDIVSLKRALASEVEADDFSSTFTRFMEEAGMTVENLADVTGLSTKTIQRMRTDTEARPKLESVVAACLGLKLYPEDSMELLSLAGYKLRKKNKEKAYSLLLNYLYEQDMIFCNNLLIELKVKPLTELHD